MPAKTKGFSLLEIMVVIGLIALVATIVVPRIRKRPIPLKQQFLKEVNSLARTAQLNALMTGKLHRVMFDFTKQSIVIEIDEGVKDSQGKTKFKPVSIPTVKTSYPFIPELELTGFNVEGKDLLRQAEGIRYTGAWFYIVPEGLAQATTITIRDQNSGNIIVVELNPFTARFSVL